MSPIDMLRHSQRSCWGARNCGDVGVGALGRFKTVSADGERYQCHTVRMGWRLAACAWLGGAAIGFVSCGGPTFVVQQYGGPPRSIDSVAIIRVNPGGLQLCAVDGESLRVAPEKGTRLHIEVLPGVHEIGVDDPSTGFAGANVRFVAEPGKVYRMVVRSVPPDPSSNASLGAYAYEVDRASDAELRPATTAPDAPAVSATERRLSPMVSDAGAPDTGG